MTSKGLSASATLLLLLSFSTAPADLSAGSYEKAAKDMGRAAFRGKVRRIAVIPFTPISGRDGQGGLVLAERITARLSAEPGVEVVERTLLEKVFKEQGLGYQGWLDQRSARKVGNVLGVDGLVTGTFLKLSRDKIEVNARLIDAETARILGVFTMKVEKDWEDTGFETDFSFLVPPPDLDGAENFPPAPSLISLKPRPAQEDCSDWERRVDEMQEAVLELKVRHWAQRLREKEFTPKALTRNPGSDIRNMGLRQDFYRKLREAHERGFEPLSMRESAFFDQVEGSVEAILQKCYY
ncbi:MAG: FlgO family outer membrane protein [Elusimicrobiota bacterium]